MILSARQNPLQHDVEDDEVMECNWATKSCNFIYDTEAVEILLVHWINSGVLLMVRDFSEASYPITKT